MDLQDEVARQRKESITKYEAIVDSIDIDIPNAI
jgi:hypothetical protein